MDKIGLFTFISTSFKKKAAANESLGEVVSICMLIVFDLDIIFQCIKKKSIFQMIIKRLGWWFSWIFSPITAIAELLLLHIPNLKKVLVFWGDVIHMVALEIFKILWDREENGGGLFLELRTRRVPIRETRAWSQYQRRKSSLRWTWKHFASSALN